MLLSPSLTSPSLTHFSDLGTLSRPASHGSSIDRSRRKDSITNWGEAFGKSGPRSFFVQQAPGPVSHDESQFPFQPEDLVHGPYRLQIPGQHESLVEEIDPAFDRPALLPHQHFPPRPPFTIAEPRSQRSSGHAAKRARTEYEDEERIGGQEGDDAELFTSPSSMSMQSIPHSASMYASFSPIQHREPFLNQQQYMAHQHLTPLPVHRHHHHHLPTNLRQEDPASHVGETSPLHSGTSVVGQEGMPEPASRPNVPKLKFSAEEDQKLVDLKENKNLTWKQIADFFPGRTSGTLQVRYCTKLKAKTVIWADDSVQRLRKAIKEYENDKWRLIAAKVGSGFSPAACQEKAEEIEAHEELAGASASPASEPASERGPMVTMPPYTEAPGHGHPSSYASC